MTKAKAISGVNFNRRLVLAYVYKRTKSEACIMYMVPLSRYLTLKIL